MRVFVTGASGWVGRALVPDLIAAGHSVVGLARSDTAAAALESAGVEVLLGDLDDLDVLGKGAAESDGVVHLAFKHDIAFTGDYAGAARADRAAISALAEPLLDTGRPLVIASGILGVLGLPPGVVATEQDGVGPQPSDQGGPVSGGGDRIDNARYAITLAERGVRSVVVRLPPSTHGPGDNGLTATAVRLARQKGAIAYLGDGSNRWPAVHRDDAARLFRLAVESAPAGSVLHAVGEEGVRIRDVAEAIAAGLGIPALSVTAEQLPDYLGFLSGFWALDGPATARTTRDRTGWKPSHPGLLADLRAGHYFG